jgi:hypothetical protein
MSAGVNPLTSCVEQAGHRNEIQLIVFAFLAVRDLFGPTRTSRFISANAGPVGFHILIGSSIFSRLSSGVT